MHNYSSVMTATEQEFCRKDVLHASSVTFESQTDFKLCKEAERALVTQIQDHLLLHDLYAKTQSTYRLHHSVDTALVRIQNE